MRPDPRRHRAELDRKRTEGRVLAAVAVLASRRLPTFEDLARDLRGVSKDDLTAALDELVGRGLIAREAEPSPILPLLSPPIVRYRPVGLQGGASLTSKAGD